MFREQLCSSSSEGSCFSFSSRCNSISGSSYPYCLYKSECSTSSSQPCFMFPLSISPSFTSSNSSPSFASPPLNNLSTFATKKYKPVAKKVCPVYTNIPQNFHIIRDIKGDPLTTLPILSPHPPPFTPYGCYTIEQHEIIDKCHPPGFLLPKEHNLMHHFMTLHQDAFAWNDSEKGHFREDFFPPVEIPTIAHKPWVLQNIPIPPGIYKEVCKLIQNKIEAGVFEPSNSLYHSHWFTVTKKDGKSLHIVQSLEPLNAVTITHSGVPPFSEQLAEQFAGRACGGMLDLFVGYDECALAKSSRDLTTFQTPFRAQCLTKLPMGWCNLVPIFHDDITEILRPEIPEVSVPYIDDVPAKGPATWYILPNGKCKSIPKNPGICCFVWEHFQNLNCIVQRMKYCGGTFSGFKTILCAPEITVLGHRCTYKGRLPDTEHVAKIVNWGPCENLTDIRAFLGTIRVCHLFIRNFAHHAHHLVKLTRQNQPFIFRPEQITTQEDLKSALLSSPALCAINYDSPQPVILSVDTSYIAIGHILSQCDEKNPRFHYISRFGSITLNDCEAGFSQAKLEIYGLYCSICALKLHLIGLWNLIVKVDMKYIKGMLAHPDLVPSASVNHWIISILTFHFELVHVPGTFHGPDGLSH